MAKERHENIESDAEREYRRITADFSPEAYEVLSKVATRLQTTKAEALRKALGLIDLVQRREAEGWRVVLEHEKTKQREVLVRY